MFRVDGDQSASSAYEAGARILQWIVTTEGPPIHIPRFEASHAAAVAAWVRDAREMSWLSPETTFPLTPAKVMAWGGPDRRQFLFFENSGTTPIGYAELNDMPGRGDQHWIGHMLLDPAVRGRSLGLACVQSLLCVSFDQLASDYVVLVVVPENDRAIRCYLRAGLVHAGDEWKRQPLTNEPYRLLRMTIDRARYRRLQLAGAALSAVYEPQPA